MTTYHTGYSPSADVAPRQWESIRRAAPDAAALAFVERLIRRGELGHGDKAFVHVRDHGVWRFTIETVSRVATVEQVSENSG